MSGATTFSKLNRGHVAIDENIANQPCLGRSGTQSPFSGDLGGEVESILLLKVGDLAL